MLHRHEDGHVGVFVLRGKIDGLHTGGAWQPDGRVRLLDGTRPDVHIAIIVMLPLEGEGAGAGPGLDNQVVRLIHALAAEGWIDVVAEVLHAGAAHKARDDAAAADNIEHSDLLRHAYGVIVQWQRVAHDADLCAFHTLGQHRRHDIGRGHGAIGVLVMLVHDHAVPTELVGAFDLIEVAVVERVTFDGVVEPVGQRHPRGVIVFVIVRRQVGPGHQVEVVKCQFVHGFSPDLRNRWSAD